MTDKDIVKGLVKEVLQENPELLRRQGIEKDRARMEAYVKEVSAPPAPRSPVDPYDSPVKVVDVEMPLQTVFYTAPAPGGESGPGTPPLAVTYVTALICNADGDVVSVDLMTRPT